MQPISTRIRFIWSKDPLKIETFINTLSFRVEIKGQYSVGKLHFLSFVYPDDLPTKHEVLTGNLD